MILWAPILRREKIKDYVSLTKPGVISLLILTTIASMYITPAGMPSLTLVIWTAIGGWLMAAASHAFNCYLDRDIDVLMGRTGRRPIPQRAHSWLACHRIGRRVGGTFRYYFGRLCQLVSSSLWLLQG
jgi:heme O synthase-like polyprenyltransferase